MDATEFDLPQAPCIVNIYNSFRGRALTAVLERMQRSVMIYSRQVRIAYVAPTVPEAFLQIPGMRIFKDAKRYIIYDFGELVCARMPQMGN
jgi:hypothetical protein